MAKVNSTLAELNRMGLEIQDFKTQYPTVSGMIADIAFFFQRNAVYINIIREKSVPIFEKYVHKDEETGNYKTLEPAEPNGARQWDFINPADKEKFEAEWNELMAKPCVIFT